MPHIAVMGVSGVGKSTVGTRLAAVLDRPLIEADELHPPENIDKMAGSIPLTDADRAPWLAEIAARLRELDARGESAVLVCSLLRASYREVLREASDLVFVHLVVDRPTLEQRIRERRGHFMPVSLLDSQLEALEPLDPSEPGFEIDGTLPIPDLIEGILERLALGS
jgi:gluconokinase